MDTAEYIHERDTYYVVDILHRTSLCAPRSTSHTYNLHEHRMIKAPRFSAQRSIMKTLEIDGVISIEDHLDRKGNATLFEKAVSFTFALNDDHSLRRYHDRLILKLEEANLNHLALTQRGTLLLEIDGEYIYIIFPYHKLRVNRIPLRSNQAPQVFFEYLIEKANDTLVTRESYPFKTSRNFDDLAIKAGFDGKIRKMFIPELSKNKIQLLSEVEMNTKDSTEIYNQLMRDDFNHQTYEKYMEGIE